MSTPLSTESDVLRLKKDAENLIQQFFEGVPSALSRHREFSPFPRQNLGDDTRRIEESIACINRIRDVIETYREDLMMQAASGILVYLTQYSVRSKSCDPLKLAYWFGRALSAKVGEQHDIDKKVALTLTVLILDMFCEWECGRSLPSDMRKKLDMSISQGKNEDDFGDYGIYFSFKAISKLSV